ncbi:MFS general substrate transporter [Conidiobolus coronatus NRRL 28638]|uniref:MFS general substrate transporter n=1 Tax=Conidiobolus coronatus (strain ATCC 28846 / CBS 209.66 / NRRL 28638) TaxID=796925 RepID=A0A137NQ58_CONC2|nr:MFS general substrate transporter [Conidiobolus coronatus NRRL 28638]|eukprot:KXN64879.1 MFS general substrate transporter [Conidiobolus coronatus NRRL 28638]
MNPEDPLQAQSLETTALLSENNRKPNNSSTPLPMTQLYILLIVRLSAPLSYSIISPFIYFMVRDFHLTEKESELGYYVGSIASCFAIAQTCTSMFWGATSDRIGRKPCIIIGLLGSSLSLFLFGLSKSLIWAILTRSLSGILNGNVGVIKTMVGELTDKTNRARAFSYLPMMMGLGNALGPVIGGFLVSPAKKLPYFFDTPFWNTYPYFLPCLAAGSINVLAAILSFYYLGETLIRLPINRSDSESSINSSDSSSNTPLNYENRQNRTVSNDSKMVMIGFALMALSSVMFNQLLVLWTATDITKGGLSFGPQDLAKAMSVTGFTILIVQLMYYPKLQQWLGTLKLYRSVFPIFMTVCILIPMVNLVAKYANNTLTWVSIIIMLILRAACNTIANTSVNILLVESAEGSGNLGKLNGFSQTLSGLSRSIAPALTGTIYSYSLSHQFPYPFDYHLVWYILALLCVCNYYYSFNIKSIH